MQVGWLIFLRIRKYLFLATKRDTATNLVDKVRVFLEGVPPLA